METHAVGPELCQVMHRVDRIQGRPDFVTEGVTTWIADRPESEREVVFRRCGHGIAHGHSFRAPVPDHDSGSGWVLAVV